MPGWRLVADVGGTNVRFARAYPDGRIDEIERWRTTPTEDFPAVLGRYLAGSGGSGGCAGAMIGAAGPVESGAIALTNSPWVIRETEVSAQLAGAPVRLLNDLEGIALALPVLEADDIVVLGPVSAPEHRHAMLAINVGTGFGAAAVLPQDGGWTSVPGEAGHASLDAHIAVRLGLDPATASIEDVLSGPGVLRIWQALTGRPPAPGDTAASILARAGTDPEARMVADELSEILGRIAGDLALTLAAWGGVFFCGGVITGWMPQADPIRFRSAFEAKGKMTGRMQRLFTGRISRSEVALAGLARARFGT